MSDVAIQPNSTDANPRLRPPNWDDDNYIEYIGTIESFDDSTSQSEDNRRILSGDHTNSGINGNQIYYIVNKAMNKWTIQKFRNLTEGWNGYDADPIPEVVITQAYEIIDDLWRQPEVFPTARKSIQFEYDNHGRSLEIEIFEDHIEYLLINEDGTETSKNLMDINQIIHIVDGFYATPST